MALRQSQQDVDALKAQHEDDEYAQRLETEGVSLRAKQQRKKDKEAVKAAEERRDRLEDLVTAAEICSKNLGRQLRVQTLEAHTEIARCESIGALAEQAGQTANKAKEELRAANRALNSQLENLQLEMDGVGARAAKAEKQLGLLQKKHRELIESHTKTKTTTRKLRTTKVDLEHECEAVMTELAGAEGRALRLAEQCRALESEGAAAASKLDTLATQTEVRYVYLSCSCLSLLFSRFALASHKIGIAEWGDTTAGVDNVPKKRSIEPGGSE
jgi:chromosome segregation ATPase